MPAFEISDELLFLLITVLDLTVMLICWKAGRRWLELFVVLNYIFAFTGVVKFTEIMGYSVTVGSVFYAAIFLGTDIITEHYGKRAGFQMVWKVFFGTTALMIAQQLMLLLSHTPETQVASDAMDALYATGPRLVAAGVVVFLFVQRFDIWFYHWIHKKTQGKMLWLRNIASTTCSQFIDSILFFSLAFYGVMPNDILIEVMVVAFVMKFIVALADTPFIYLSYWIKGKKLSEAKHIPEA